MKLAAICILGLLLAGMSSGNRGVGKTSQTAPTPMKKPVFSDDNNPIRILKGMEFSIVLDSNPTTGYSWEPAVPLDNDILILLEKSYRRPDTPRRGAGGKKIWIFRARRPGRTEIHLEYVRSWEKDRPAARTRIFKVVVSELADSN